MFKAGDKVRVVEPMGGIKDGEVYTVKAADSNYVYLKGKPEYDGWFHRRFELVEEQDMANYPTDLNVGDVLHSSTGRTYTVASVDNGKRRVSYAYIPANSRDNKIQIDSRRFSELHWVSRVTNKQGQIVWPKRQVQVGDKVLHSGVEWTVDSINDFSGKATLRRIVTKQVNRDMLEAL